MLKKINLLACFFILFSAPLSLIQALPGSSLNGSQQEPQITVNNRILAKVNGKAISVLDVMKKMDLIFHREYPDLEGSIPAKYQFYSHYWHNVLDNMINEELILANAAEIKLTISDGDARQELEDLFGPNVVLNIDKLGLTYQEALKMIHNELLVSKMDYFMVHSKAMNRVGPKEIRAAYEIYAKEHPIDATWTYEVLSIRGPSQLSCAAVAEQSYQMLVNEKIPFDKIPATLKSRGLLKEKTVATVSEESARTEKTISSQHKDILVTLTPGNFSKPVSQVSRADKSTVYRIFYLKEQTKAGIIPLANVEDLLKAQLMEKVTEEESDLYHRKLRLRFGVNEDYLSSMIPEDFQPFALLGLNASF